MIEGAQRIQDSQCFISRLTRSILKALIRIMENSKFTRCPRSGLTIFIRKYKSRSKQPEASQMLSMIESSRRFSSNASKCVSMGLKGVSIVTSVVDPR